VDKKDKHSTLNTAFALRLTDLLVKHNMSKYRFEKETGLTHSALRHIFNGNNKDVMLSSAAKAANVFKMSLAEFFDNEIFCLDGIEFEY